MNFLCWLYVVIYLWLAQRRGQRPVSAAEYVANVSISPIGEKGGDAKKTSKGLPTSGLR